MKRVQVYCEKSIRETVEFVVPDDATEAEINLAAINLAMFGDMTGDTFYDVISNETVEVIENEGFDHAACDTWAYIRDAETGKMEIEGF